MGFMTGDEADQDKTLTSFRAWNCVVIYALCEALHCNAEKCQVRYLHEMINYILCMNPVNAEQQWLLVKTIMLVN